MSRRATILAALLVPAVALAAGCTGAKSSSSGSDVEIRISYSGDWSGSYGDIGGQSSVDGSGPRTITIEDAESVVSCAFQKKDAGAVEMKVEIVKNGKVLKSGSTTAAYGVVSVATPV